MTKSTFRIFLLSFLILLYMIPAASDAAKSFSTTARHDYAAVEKYIVTLDLIAEKHMVSGEVEIIAPPGVNFSGEVTLNLHEDMDVRSLSVFPGGAKTFKREGDLIKLNAGPGASKIFASFYGDPSRYITPKNSFTYIGKEGCYFDDLCSYFPRAGFDQKSFFELSVAHDKNWTPLTQGEMISSFETSGGRVVSHFINAKKSRCHTLAAGPYSKISSGEETPFKINVFFYEKDSEAAEEYLKEARSALDFYRSSYGDNGIKTLNIVEVEKVFPGGYGPEEVVYITASAFGGEGVDSELLAHEIAHQWFGNFVLGEFPESNFLNEAFATYASLEYVREKHGAIYQKKYDELRRQYLSYRFRAGKDEKSIADASKNPTAGFAYQTLIYYRGMMVLKASLHYLGLALDKSQSSLVRDYLSYFAEKTLTVEDFKARLFDKSSSFFSTNRIINEKAFETASFVFDSFYGSTAAIELRVNGAVFQKNSGGSLRALIELERTDNIDRDFELDIAFYASENQDALKPSTPASNRRFSRRNSNLSGKIELISDAGDYKLIERKKFNARRGVNNLDFTLSTNRENIKYIIDEGNDHLISYAADSFGPPPAATDSVAVFSESSPLAQKFRDFCRELAGKICSETVSDNLFNPRDFLKYRNIILIGDFSESPLKRFITQNFNVDFDGRKAFTKNCFNERTLDLDNGVSAEFSMKNPLLKNGTVTLLLFSNQPGARGYTHLNRTFNDYCLYDIFSKTLKADSFNYGLSGSLRPGPQNVKILYSSAGLDKYYISGAPATLLFDIYNASGETVEAVLETGDDQSGRREEPLALAPKQITRHESRPLILKRNSVDFALRGSGGIVLEKNVLSGTALAPRTASYAVCAHDGSKADSIVSAINFIYSHYLKSASYAQTAKVNLAFAPLNPLSYSGFKGIVLDGFDMASAPQAFDETLKSYVQAGGRVIISGGRMSEIYSARTARFMKEIFSVDLNSSKIHDFDTQKPGVRSRFLKNGTYFFTAPDWKTVLNPSAANFFSSAAGESFSPSIGGDNPNFLFESGLSGEARLKSGTPPLIMFGSRLIRKKMGNGAFYYLPYDFSDEVLKNSIENFYISKTLFGDSDKSVKHLVNGEAPELVMYDPSEKSWPLNIQYFIIFMLIYILSFSMIYLHALKTKTGFKYIIYSVSLTAFYCLLLAAAGYSITDFKYPPQILSYCEVPPYYAGPLLRTDFYKIWGGGEPRLSIEFEGLHLSHATAGSYFNKINFTDTPSGNKVEVYNPLIFYPVIFSSRNNGGAAVTDKSFSVRAARPAGKPGFTLQFGRGSLEFLGIKGAAAALIKTPGGYFIREVSDSTGDYVFDDASIQNFEAAIESAKKCLKISEAQANSLKNLLRVYEEKNPDSSASVLFILSAGETAVKYDGAANASACKRLDAFAVTLDIETEKNSIIADYSFKKETVFLNNEAYKTFTFNLSGYKERVLNSDATSEIGLTAYIKLNATINDGRKTIENFCDSFISAFSDNLNIYDSFYNASSLKFPFKGIYATTFINLMHDNKKNFEYNINNISVVFKIKNFEHYLNYNLYDNNDLMRFYIKCSALRPNETNSGINVTLKYE